MVIKINLEITEQKIKIECCQFNKCYIETPDLLIGTKKGFNDYKIFALGNDVVPAINHEDSPKYEKLYDFKVIKAFSENEFDPEYSAYYLKFFTRKMYNEIYNRLIIIIVLRFIFCIDKFEICFKNQWLRNISGNDKKYSGTVSEMSIL